MSTLIVPIRFAVALASLSNGFTYAPTAITNPFIQHAPPSGLGPSIQLSSRHLTSVSYQRRQVHCIRVVRFPQFHRQRLIAFDLYEHFLQVTNLDSKLVTVATMITKRLSRLFRSKVFQLLHYFFKRHHFSFNQVAAKVAASLREASSKEVRLPPDTNESSELFLLSSNRKLMYFDSVFWSSPLGERRLRYDI